MCNICPIFMHLLTAIFSKPPDHDHYIAECTQSFPLSFSFSLMNSLGGGEQRQQTHTGSHTNKRSCTVVGGRKRRCFDFPPKDAFASFAKTAVRATWKRNHFDYFNLQHFLFDTTASEVYCCV